MSLFDTLPPARKPQEPAQAPAKASAFPRPRPTERRPLTALGREAKRRRRKNAALADELERWADASNARAERMRSGPLFGGKE